MFCYLRESFNSFFYAVSESGVCVCVCRGGLTDGLMGGVKDNPHISDSDASVKKGQLLHFAHKCKRLHLALFFWGGGETSKFN